jgi:hypothetical protein
VRPLQIAFALERTASLLMFFSQVTVRRVLRCSSFIREAKASLERDAKEDAQRLDAEILSGLRVEWLRPAARAAR